MQEEKWFVPPTWNHEKLVTEVFILLRAGVPINSVMNIACDYLSSIGFRLENKSETLDKKKNDSLTVIKVDLVEKSYRRVSSLDFHRLQQQYAFTTFPSHIPAFMETHRGRLTGKKFGL
jgi:hypothetical protein